MKHISKAIKFSSDYDYLSKLRMSLREKVLKSPIFDASLFGKNFNDVLWSMWKKFEN